MKLLIFLLFLAITSCASDQSLYRENRDQPRTESKNQVSPAKNSSAASSNHTRTKPETKDDSLSTATNPPQKKEEGGLASGSVGSVKTDEEKTMYLEDKLDGSLSEFDDLLLKKNQDIAQQNNRSGGGSQIGSEGKGGMSGDDAAIEPHGTKDSTTSPITGSGHQGSGGTMEPKKEYDNDDVVARQIREAAEKETDPELKQKLWDEYRKYKSGN